jgi:biopolymer transport protein TolQ
MLNINNVILADAGVWYAFSNSDGMGKAIVFLLFISSMVAWFIMIEKGLALYRSQKLSERFAANFNRQHGMQSMLREGMDNPCPVAKVYISGMEQLLEFYGQKPEDARTAVPRGNKNLHKLSSAQLDAIQTAMEREISGQIFVIEERIGMLATAVSLAPFLGLFGTVWGVMIAFCGVASAGSANIQALAPGVAGALLTTVAGLLVAIPSLVGYNFLTQMIRKITVSMDNFSEAFMAQLKLEQLAVREAENAAVRSGNNNAVSAGHNTSTAPRTASSQAWNASSRAENPVAATPGSLQNRQSNAPESATYQTVSNRQMTFSDLNGSGTYTDESVRQ